MGASLVYVDRPKSPTRQTVILLKYTINSHRRTMVVFPCLRSVPFDVALVQHTCFSRCFFNKEGEGGGCYEYTRRLSIKGVFIGFPLRFCSNVPQLMNEMSVMANTQQVRHAEEFHVTSLKQYLKPPGCVRLRYTSSVRGFVRVGRFFVS